VAHKPRPEAIDKGLLAGIRARGPVRLVNTQPDTTVRDLGRAGFGTLMGDLHTWTAAAVTLAQHSLAGAGIETNENAQRSLSLSVTEVSLGVAGIDFVASVPKCKVGLKIATGDGGTRELSDERKAMSPPSACDAALSGAVGLALSAPEIVTYLNR
jgi:hypothetical protein